MAGVFVAREAELAQLCDHLDCADGQLLLVSGEAGVGKTHLVTAAVEGRAARWVTFPRARYPAAGLGLQRLAEMPGGDALHAELTGPAFPSPVTLAAIYRAADDVLARAAPCVLVLDDVQWADELTLSWLSHAADLLRTAPVAIVAILRATADAVSRFESALAPLRRAMLVSTLQVTPLDVDGSAALARSLGHRPTRQQAVRLHERCDGLPLAVAALLDGVRPEALDSLLDAPSEGPLALLRAVVREQCEDLPETARELCSLAALAPQPVPESVLRALFDEAQVFDRALEAAIGAGLLVRVDRHLLGFRHDLHREVLRSDQPLAARRERHRRLAGVLSAQQPAQPAAVAEQLAEAGDAAAAVTWLRRAAADAGAAHDHGTALTHLRHALRMSRDGLTRKALIDEVATTAVYAQQVGIARNLVDDELDVTTDPAEIGGLLLSRSRLDAYAGDFTARTEDLRAACAAFAQAGDDRRRAAALGALALPSGGDVSLAERVAAGRAGLELARRSGDTLIQVQCANNLATAELSTGDPVAFSRWVEAVEQAGVGASEQHRTETLRALANWAVGALVFGEYAAAADVVRRGESLAFDPVWRCVFAGMDALRLYRIGRWDEALSAARRANDGAWHPDAAAMATAVAAAITFEREPHPDILSLETATSQLLRRNDDQWGPVALAILVRVRAARREPDAGRGMPQFLASVVGGGVLVGWDELLPTAASLGPAAFRKVEAATGGATPAGRAATASQRHAHGMLAPSWTDAVDALLDAADSYAALPDPYREAKALQAAAEVRVRAGRRAGAERVAAAERFEAIGADRSLATLLRRSGRTRALERFRVPVTQRRAGSAGLTPREMEVADLARHGDTAGDIARVLGITESTVRSHLERVKQKLGVERKHQLVRLLSGEPDSG